MSGRRRVEQHYCERVYPYVHSYKNTLARMYNSDVEDESGECLLHKSHVIIRLLRNT